MWDTCLEHHSRGEASRKPWGERSQQEAAKGGATPCLLTSWGQGGGMLITFAGNLDRAAALIIGDHHRHVYWSVCMLS